MYVGGEIADLAAHRAAAHRRRDRGPAASTSRGSGSLDAIEGAKGELVEALPRRRHRRPQRRRRTRPPDGATGPRPGSSPTASPTMPTCAPSEVESPASRGMRFDLRRRPDRRAGQHPGPRPAGRPQRAGRARPSGVAGGLEPTAIVAGLAAGGRAPHRGESSRAGGVTIVDDSLQRLARVDAGRARAARRPARPAGRRPRRDARAGRRVGGRPSLGRRGGGGRRRPARRRRRGRRCDRRRRLGGRPRSIEDRRGRQRRRGGVDAPRPPPGRRLVLVKASRGIGLDVLVEPSSRGSGRAPR